jgi:hypothetical protein
MTPPRFRGGVVVFLGGEGSSMTERHRDPLELWVGTWTPEEWIKRENRRREESAAEMKTSESSEGDTTAKAE